MSTHRVDFHAHGMHCSGCEHIIEDSVGKLAGVQHVKADYPTEMVAVVFDPAVTNVEDICAAIRRKGYRCTLADNAEAPRNNFKKLGAVVLGILGIVVLIFLDTKWISQSGAPDVSQHMGLGLILVLGLLTGFHCVGMCGGFVLSYTAGDARLGQSSHLSHLLYGVGKTLSYTVIGALFGLLGAIVAFTPMLRGVAGVSAGIFLIIFGLNMLNIFPVLRKIRLKLPASLSWVLSGQQTRSRKRPFMIGLLNGLMIACGPLQALYVMAAGTGSALEGAKMLFTFGVGTLPVLLSFGFLTSLISGALTHQLLRASGVILILLGAVMINRGLILTGAGYDLQSVMTSASSKLGWAESPHPTSPMVDHFQTITMDVIKSGFEPNHFVLRQGIPKEGVQTIAFTPNETGIIPWSCWMGMLHGQFEVITEPAITEKPPSVASMDKPPPRPSGSMSARPPATTEEPTVKEKNAGIPETYRVTAGDTLSKIAHKRYGDATKWREIESTNPGLNLKKLKAGQILYLPNLPVKDSIEKRQ